MKWFDEIVEYRQLLYYLVRQHLAVRYEGTWLGFLWTLLHPLLVFASLSWIFAVINGQSIAEYGVHFLSGYVFWLLFTNTTMAAADSVLGQASLVTRAAVPKLLLPISIIGVNLVDLAATLVILFSIMIASGAHFSLPMLFLPVSCLISIVFVSGVSIACAALNVIFRDFRYLLQTAFFVLFFFCPILWRESSAPPAAGWVLELNPLVSFLRLFQRPVVYHVMPDARSIVIAVSCAVLAMVAGIALFRSKERNFYYYL